MPRSKEQASKYMRDRRLNNVSVKKKEKEACANWRRNNPEKARLSYTKYRENLKLEVLTRYGKDGKLMCSWDDCYISDIDMLTLDHKNNDGAKHRKSIGKGGSRTYIEVKRLGFPEGFQTLCWNHQWKKEISIMKKRAQ